MSVLISTLFAKSGLVEQKFRKKIRDALNLLKEQNYEKVTIPELEKAIVSKGYMRDINRTDFNKICKILFE